MLRDCDSCCSSCIGSADGAEAPPCSPRKHTNRSARGQAYLHLSPPAKEMAPHLQKGTMCVGMRVKCALQPCAVNMTAHGIFTAFLSGGRNAPRSTSHYPLFIKVLQHFRGEQAEHAPSPVLVSEPCRCPEQSYWEHTGILRLQISASVPFGGGTYWPF